MKRLFNQLLILLVFALLLPFFSGCNRIPYSELLESDLKEYQKNPYLTITSPGDYFDLLYTDTLLFAGTEICTLKTNGVADSISRDSLYMRIIPLIDTIIPRNGQIYGMADIKNSELTGLIKILDLVRSDTNHFPLKLFKTYVTDTIYKQVEICALKAEQDARKDLDSLRIYSDSGTACAGTDTLKNGILKGFTAMMSDLNFTKKYKAEFEDYKNQPPLEMINKEFINLRRLGVFSDDSGAPKKEGLSPHETENIKWFNIDLIVNEIFTGIFSKHTSFYKVRPLKFQRGPNLANLSKEEITRYFYATYSALYQYWYRDQDGFHSLSDTLVMPYQPKDDTVWKVTPLYWTPLKAIPYSNMLGPLQMQGQAKITRLKYHTEDNKYTFFISNNYEFQGNTTLENQNVRIFGFISVNNGYFSTLDYSRTHRESLIYLDYFWPDKIKTIIKFQYLDIIGP